MFNTLSENIVKFKVCQIKKILFSTCLTSTSKKYVEVTQMSFEIDFPINMYIYSFGELKD